MALKIKFPFYAKYENEQTFVKMFSPYDLIEVFSSDTNSIIHRITNEDEFSGAYQLLIKDELLYSNKQEFDSHFSKAVEKICPQYAMLQIIHLN